MCIVHLLPIAFKQFYHPDLLCHFNKILTTTNYDIYNIIKIHVADLTNWLVADSTPNHQKGIIIWNYEDSTGYKYLELTYSQKPYILDTGNKAVNKTNNTITLSDAWP